ncbi:hypothetical protein BGW80DRAFT_1529972 [Lactifluus volemus]|nr:hypothetical protein BGW80DRAFT_1529972 [Lactifluus volemus]
MNDPLCQLYSYHTWHTTSIPSASATIQFNGMSRTGIWFFGAKRPEYGTFNISIDGLSVSGNAQSQHASFQQLLGGRSGLIDGPHTAVITNTGSAIDLDSIVFDTQVGSPNATITNTTTDDTSPDIHYFPTPKDWALGNLEGSYNGTHHHTQTGGAQAQFTFNGNAVAVYGTVSPEHANYTVTVDGVTRAFPNGLASSLHAGVRTPYFANNFAPGSHNLTLTASPQNSSDQNTGNFTDIDRIVVFNAIPPTFNNDSESKSVRPQSPGTVSQNNRTQVSWT